MEKWTQDQAIAFECAREVITDLMAICSGRIFDEAERKSPNVIFIAELRAKRTKLSKERAELHVDDHSDIERIRKDYGEAVLAWRAEHPEMVA